MNVLKPVVFAVLGAVIATAAFGNVPPPPQPPRPVPPPAPAWEYRVFVGSTDAAELTKIGAEGWELATSYNNHPNGGATHTFKRRK